MKTFQEIRRKNYENNIFKQLKLNTTSSKLNLYNREYDDYPEIQKEFTREQYLAKRPFIKEPSKMNLEEKSQIELLETVLPVGAEFIKNPNIKYSTNKNKVKKFDFLITHAGEKLIGFMKSTDSNPYSNTTGGGAQDELLIELESTINHILNNKNDFSYIFVLEGRFWQKHQDKVKIMTNKLTDAGIFNFCGNTDECTEYLSILFGE